MNNRPKRSIKPPSSLKEYIVLAELDGDDIKEAAKLKLETKRHTKVNTSLLKCRKCDVKCKGKKELINHIKIHKGKENYLCEDCGKSLSSFQAFSEHLNIHKNIKPYSCDICGHQSRQWSVHSRHLVTHEKHPAQIFKCSVCSKPFKNKEYLKQHMRKHLGVKPYECDQCTKLFTAKTELNRHKISHSSHRPFVCTHCGKKFKLKHNLSAHIKAHTGKQIFKCCLCKASFPQQCLMEKHKKSHTEVIQHLELVKTDQRTLTITSCPLDQRKVLHHQKVSLPPKLDLNDSQNASNSKVSLGLNDAFIPISVIANSFGTGNYIKMKIVDQINLAAKNGTTKKFTEMSGVTNAVLVDEESASTEIGKEEQKTTILTESKVANETTVNVEEMKSEGDQTELPLKVQLNILFDSFEKTFNTECMDEEKLLWLQGLKDVVVQLNFPLEYTVCQQLHSVSVKLQHILITTSVIDEDHHQTGSPLNLHAPSCDACSLSPPPNDVCKPKEGNTEKCEPQPNNEETKYIDKSGLRVQLCDSEPTEKDDFKRARLKRIHKFYLFVSDVLQKHFKVTFK